MTDYLPPPPDLETRIKDLKPGQLEYQAQNGPNHKFWAKVSDTLYSSDTFYSQANVYQYEQAHRSLKHRIGMIEEFEEALKEALANEVIESDLAQSFADIFGISLSREYEVTVTVQFSLSIELPMDEDVERFVDNLDFSVVEPCYSDGEVTASDWEVTDTNWTDV